MYWKGLFLYVNNIINCENKTLPKNVINQKIIRCNDEFQVTGIERDKYKVKQTSLIDYGFPNLKITAMKFSWQK